MENLTILLSFISTKVKAFTFIFLIFFIIEPPYFDKLAATWLHTIKQ